MRARTLKPASALASALAAATLVAACGGSNGRTAAAQTSGTTVTSTTTTSSGPLPGSGRPSVVIGDKNYTEQFVLGELYYQALEAEGFKVQLDRNIGPTSVTFEALQSGSLGMYPEYLNTWNLAVAGVHRQFRTLAGAYRAGQAYAGDHGLQLLAPTPFSDSGAIAVTDIYARHNGLRSIGDLRRVAGSLTMGGPPQFQSQPAGLPALEEAYRFTPATFKPLDVGGQYDALNTGAVQAAEVGTTDGELASGNYELLGDPRGVFGFGQVVPVVSAKVLAAEGPTFAGTINAVSALLTVPVVRQLNFAVDVAHQDPAAVARAFLETHGLIPATSG